jgi:hypothetical protein
MSDNSGNPASTQNLAAMAQGKVNFTSTLRAEEK